jgi:hypothetical protein
LHLLVKRDRIGQYGESGEMHQPMQINWPYICLWDIADSNLPPDMLKALCVDASGLLLQIVIPRLLYRKQKADVLSFCQKNSTFGAMVSVSLTARGLTTDFPVAITQEEASVLDMIVDITFKHPARILSDGRIPVDMRWAPNSIIKRVLAYIEANKESLLNEEQAILNETNPSALEDLQRKGIFIEREKDKR